MPKASPSAEALFQRLLPSDPEVSVRRMFGQPTAFCHGQMFLGVFGDQVFVRLAEVDRESAADIPGAGPFEPMPGRPMREYMVLPAKVLGDAKQATLWVGRSLRYARSLPVKVAKGR